MGGGGFERPPGTHGIALRAAARALLSPLEERPHLEQRGARQGTERLQNKSEQKGRISCLKLPFNCELPLAS